MSNKIASQVKFVELCQVFEATRSSKKQQKAVSLIKFIADYKLLAKNLSPSDGSFYPVLRLILPQLDRDRAAYGLKEHTLGKKITKILCLPPQGADAKHLTNFRTTNSNIGDFAEAVFFVVKKHFINGEKLSIAEVNNYLNTLAERHTENDPRGLDEKLYELLQNTSAFEQKWLIRIIMKDLRLGIGQDRILKLYHPDAVDLFSSNNSLLKVCETLSDLTIRLNEIEVAIFSPFRPMLSQRCDVNQFNKIFSGSRTFYVENKFDGERFQLHMENNTFKYFSRNGYDYTSTYGSNFYIGLYTTLLKNVFKSHVTQIILDGEMMGWNKTTKTFGSKGMEFDVKHLKPNNKHQPCFCVFDILMLNGKVLSNSPLMERLLELDKVLQPVEGVIIISKRIEVDSKQEILDALNESMDKKEEGIVFKDVMSLYKSNDRNAGWWKMKLEYFENVMSDLDVIVIGGYYGEGRNRKKIAGFLVGVSVPSTSNNLKPSGYISLAKISSGLSNEELDIIDENLGPHWKKLNEGDPSEYGLQWGKEKPDVWIPPNKSCVLLVRASELIKIHTSDFKTNYTLRFPRIQKIRLDKPYYDCLSTEELQALTSTSKSVEKLSKRHLELSDLEVPEKVRKIKRRYLSNEEVQVVEEKSKILMGYIFYVLTGYEDWKKSDVEVAIRENGGKVVKYEGIDTLCILVGDGHPRVEYCKSSDSSWDLVKLSWLRNVLDTGVFKMYSPLDLLHTSKKTRTEHLGKYDKYGDSFTDDLQLDSLIDILKNVEESGDYIHPTVTEQKELYKELNCPRALTIFENKLGFFEQKEICVIEKSEFQFLGGSVSSTLNKDVNLIISNERYDGQETELQQNWNFNIHETVPLTKDRNFIRKEFSNYKNQIVSL